MKTLALEVVILSLLACRFALALVQELRSSSRKPSTTRTVRLLLLWTAMFLLLCCMAVLVYLSGVTFEDASEAISVLIT